MSEKVSVEELAISKARLDDALKRGTAAALKKCLYVMNDSVIDESNRDGHVESFDLAVDRQQLLENKWWLGSVNAPVSRDDVSDLIIAKFTLISSPHPSDYKLNGIHSDHGLSESSVTKHAVFLTHINVLVPVLGKFIAKKGAEFIKEQIEVAHHHIYLVCSTKALLFESVGDVKNDLGTLSVNMGNCFPWKVDYEKTSTYTGLCFYKI